MTMFLNKAEENQQRAIVTSVDRFASLLSSVKIYIKECKCGRYTLTASSKKGVS